MVRLSNMSTTKRILLFSGFGALLALAVAALASLMPSVFGIFTLTFWALPALLGAGAHDSVIWPLGLFGASLFYGFFSFAVSWAVTRWTTRNKSR